MKVCTVTCVKNEGPFLLEWIAFNRLIGVSDFLIFSNHCDDGTTELLDRLDVLGFVRHVPNPSEFLGRSDHHRVCLQYAPLHREFRTADYVWISDVDEFLDVRVGDGTIPGLLAHNGNPDVISISELIFGFSGNVEFRDRPVLESFTTSVRIRPRGAARRGVKSIQRVSDAIAAYSNHRPTLHEGQADRLTWLNGAGQPVERSFVEGKDRGLPALGTYRQAALCHYTLRSGESLLAKFHRGDAVRPARLNTSYFTKRRGNDIRNERMLPRVDALKKEIARLKEDSELARLHDVTVASHVATIARLKEMPEYRELWAAIRKEAAQPLA